MSYTQEEAEQIAEALRGRLPTEVEVVFREAAICLATVRGKLVDLRDAHDDGCSALAYPRADDPTRISWKIETPTEGVIQQGIRLPDGTDEAVMPQDVDVTKRPGRVAYVVGAALVHDGLKIAVIDKNDAEAGRFDHIPTLDELSREAPRLRDALWAKTSEELLPKGDAINWGVDVLTYKRDYSRGQTYRIRITSFPGIVLGNPEKFYVVQYGYGVLSEGWSELEAVNKAAKNGMAEATTIKRFRGTRASGSPSLMTSHGELCHGDVLLLNQDDYDALGPWE